jgi:hypothetical protein
MRWRLGVESVCSFIQDRDRPEINFVSGARRTIWALEAEIRLVFVFIFVTSKPILLVIKVAGVLVLVFLCNSIQSEFRLGKAVVNRLDIG